MQKKIGNQVVSMGGRLRPVFFFFYQVTFVYFVHHCHCFMLSCNHLLFQLYPQWNTNIKQMCVSGVG